MAEPWNDYTIPSLNTKKISKPQQTKQLNDAFPNPNPKTYAKNAQ